MADSNTIQRFLESNSSMSTKPNRSGYVAVTLKSQYRPDKLFMRDDFMKWDMIYNNIDTPHRLAKGAVVVRTDRSWLKTELNDLTDFKI